MQNVFSTLQRVEDKIIQLTQKLEYLKKENIILIEENVKLKKEIEKNRGGSEVINEVVVQKQEDREMKSKKQSEQLRRDLDKHIVEIDKCIELINNM